MHIVDEYYGQLRQTLPSHCWKDARSAMERMALRLAADCFDPVRDIEQFHRKFGLQYAGGPRYLPTDLFQFRVAFLAEELTEYLTNSDVLKQLVQSALTEHLKRNPREQPLDKQFDALIDLVYVALGTAYLHGFDFREGWRRVQAANMAKVRALRPIDSQRNSTFDVIKPPGWEPPNLSDLV